METEGEEGDTLSGWVRQSLVHAQTIDEGRGVRGIEERQSLQVLDAEQQAEKKRTSDR